MGFRVHLQAFQPRRPKVGVGTVDEGVYRDGKWIPGRRLNGDEDDQGRAWRFGSSSLQIERCTTYRYNRAVGRRSSGPVATERRCSD